MTGSIEVRIIFLQSKTVKTPRRRLQSGCVFNFQERKESRNQTFGERTGEWRVRRTMITGPGFQDLRWKHWPESFCRKSKGFMKAQKGRQSLKNGRLNKTPKTPKTTKTSTGGARIAGYGPVGFYEYSSSFSYKKKNPNASPTWKIQFGLSLFESPVRDFEPCHLMPPNAAKCCGTKGLRFHCFKCC